MLKHTSSILARWLPMALVISFAAALVYVTMQQNYRQNANDPQIQLAYDTVRQLTQGAPLEAILIGPPVPIETSLAPYLVIFDAAGQAVAGTGQLHGQLPGVPFGVLDVAEEEGENRITWQPEPGVRSAIVVMPYMQGSQRGYVLAGRSLTMVEDRVARLGFTVVVAWGVGILAALGLASLLELNTAWFARATPK